MLHDMINEQGNCLYVRDDFSNKEKNVSQYFLMAP